MWSQKLEMLMEHYNGKLLIEWLICKVTRQNHDHSLNEITKHDTRVIHQPVVMSVIARLKMRTLYDVRKSALLRRKTATRRPLLQNATTAMIPMVTRKAMCGSPVSWENSEVIFVLFILLLQLDKERKEIKRYFEWLNLVGSFTQTVTKF